MPSKKLPGKVGSSDEGEFQVGAQEERGDWHSNSSRFGSYVLLILLSVIWGVAFVAIKFLDTTLSPVNLALIRWFIAGAGYLAILPILGRSKTRFESKDLPRLLVISFANVPLYHLSLYYGETNVSAGLAGLLVAVGPVLIVLLSRITLKERIGKTRLLAIIIATVGALILSIQDLKGSFSSLEGPLEVIVTAVAYAIFAVFSKPLVAKYGPLPIAIRAGIVGTVMIVPLVSDSFFVQISALDLDGWLSVLFLSILSTVVGYSIFYTLVSRGAVSKLSIQLYLIPIVSVVSGAVLLGEDVSFFTVIGGAAILLAVAIVNRSARQKTPKNLN